MDLNIIKSVIIGHAVGDALGVPVEFVSRDDLEKAPITDMQGFGTYPYLACSWSDDTSMSLCALDVISKGYCDLDEIMVNFGKWYYNAEFTPTGEMFDVVNTCSRAIDNYFTEHRSTKNCGISGEYANGNGFLMRMHPFVLYFIARDGNLTMDGILRIFAASDMTHRHARSAIGCGIYAFVLQSILEMRSKASINLGLAKARDYFSCEPELKHYERIFKADFRELSRSEIKSSGYIVHTLEAALWCLLTTDNYRDCVLKSVNLGDDTDIVAAIAGRLAGALYGYDAIPEEWCNTLLRRDYSETICDRAARNWKKHDDTPITDLHMHVVPDVDDDAEDIEMSMDMLELAYEQGVRRIYCSSHSSSDINKYNENFEVLKAAAKIQYPDVILHPSCEIYCSQTNINTIFHDIDKGSLRTIGNTCFVLLEFDIDENRDVITTYVSKFTNKGYIPVIAHAERYTAFTDNAFVMELLGKGAYIQVNAYSFVEESNMDVKLRACEMLVKR